jgi:ATP-binding cassette subfamily C protein LapB
VNKVVEDPLLECLEIAVKLNGKEFFRRTALAGLPLVDQRLTPSVFPLAAERAGFETNLDQHAFRKLRQLATPAILICHHNDACVLTGVSNDGTMQIVTAAGEEKKVTGSELASLYAGYAIEMKLAEKYDERVKEVNKEKKEDWFWSTMSLSKGIYGYVLLASFFINLFVFISPLFVMNVYDKVIPNRGIQTLWALVIGAIIFFTFDFVVKVLRGYLMNLSNEITDKMLSEKLLKHTLDLKMSKKPKSAGVLLRNFNDFWDLREFFSSASMILIVDLPFVVLYLIGIWFIAGSLVIVPLVSIPIILIFSKIFSYPIKKIAKGIVLGSSQQQGILIEAFAGTETIKATSSQASILKKWLEVGSMYIGNISQARAIVQFSNNFTTYIQNITVIVLMIYGTFQIIDGHISVGALVAASILTSRCMMVGQIAGLLFKIEKSFETMRNLNSLITMDGETQYGKDFFNKEFVEGAIKFESINFTYPDQHLPVLKNISLTIKPGERVAIVGRVGSGKSTLLKLLVNLYQPNGGAVLLDNIEVSEFSPVNLRRHVQYVSTDSVIFYGTVRDNLRLCNPQASDDRVIQSAEITGIDKFIHASPDGYDTQVGERGENLSSGQRQAITLARAIASDAEVLLLDEPTASIDNYSGMEFMERLTNFLDKQTMILVTHRPSLLKFVDRIIVLEEGKIVMDGPRDEIIQQVKLKPSGY